MTAPTKGPQSGTKGKGTRGGIKPTSQPARMVAAIEAAGEAGVSSASLAAMLKTSLKKLIQVRMRARESGFVFFTLARCIPEGGLFFAQEKWRDAAAAEWRAQAPARRAAYEAKPQRKEAQRRKAAERWAKQKAEREAKREAKRAAMPPKPVKAPKLHALGAVIPRAIGIDGKAIPKHNQTTQRSPRPTINAGPVDFSRAKLTLCPSSTDNRFTPQVVHRVVDSSECRPWARAAAGARA